MLRQLLEAFSNQSILSTSALAVGAGVEETMLIQMLGELVRMGYLVENVECGASCAGCTQETLCKPTKAQPQRMWMLSAKGRNLIHQA